MNDNHFDDAGAREVEQIKARLHLALADTPVLHGILAMATMAAELVSVSAVDPDGARMMIARITDEMRAIVENDAA